MRSLKLALALNAVVGLAPAYSQGPVPNYPTGPIELGYFGDGPWSVTLTEAAGCVHKPVLGQLVTIPLACEIYHPAELGTDPAEPGSDGFRHPIVIWGNGTGAGRPGAYAYWLRHLASWGFVVIRTSDATAGSGDTLLASLTYLVAQDADPASIFHGRLDPTRAGAAGHSQGAAGALNAMNLSGGAIRTVVTFHLPFNSACITPCVDEQALAGATQGSIFYVSGTEDAISRDTQLLPGPLNSNTAFYEATPAALTKAKAMLIGGAHNDITGSPTCLLLCSNGVYGYLGYPTAWLMWRLRDAPEGRDAFASPEGEIFLASENWQGVVSNVD